MTPDSPVEPEFGAADTGRAVVPDPGRAVMPDPGRAAVAEPGRAIVADSGQAATAGPAGEAPRHLAPRQDPQAPALRSHADTIAG
ncbi:MAG: hypothetical protein ACXV2G_10410, partial [Actinomycetes bacterium]